MHEEKNPAVYILASRRNGTLYIGITGDLCNRISQHKDGKVSGFSQKYNTKILVWFQSFNSMDEAIKREKHVKEWKRSWKLELIEKSYPDWHDLFFLRMRNDNALKTAKRFWVPSFDGMTVIGELSQSF